MLSFLQQGLEQRLSPSTLKVYVAAMSSKKMTPWMDEDPRWRRDRTLRPLRVPKTVLLCLLMTFVRLKILSTYRQFIRNSLRNTSMTAKAFWISATLYKYELSPAAAEKLQGLCLLLEPDLETAGSLTDAIRTRRRRKRCERGRKRGKRGGIRARLRANPTRPALPTLMLSNVRSLENKLDLIQLTRSTQHEARDCCVFVFTETWLNDNIPDSAIQLNKLTCYRADRDKTLSGKSRGGGLCLYINKEWCNNAAVLSKHCSPLVEFMFVKCRPFYLPREFTAIVIAAVYIPPCANAKDALRELYSAISEQQTNNPDGFFIIAGDFNHANLKTVLPKFYQHVNFATRGNNILDFVYTTVKNAYKAVPRPHLGYSDHIYVMLIPAYRPLLKLAKPVQKLITIWPENATSTLQDCFQCTDWNMFKEAATYNNHTDLQEYTETVTAYIKKCMDDVTVTKTITTRANQKP